MSTREMEPERRAHGRVIRVGRLLAVVLPVAIVLVAGWQHRWMSDDGFINLRVVDMIEHGHGPVFNAGERVEAFTSPLWILALLAGDVVAPLRLEWVAVLGGIMATAGGLALAIFAARRLARGSGLLVPVGALIVASVAVVWDFASSGLETGLTFLWLGGLGVVLARWATGGRFGPFAAVVVGLGPLVRPDLALFTVLALVGVVAADWSRQPWRRHVVVVGFALAVPVAYQVFRMGYYGSLVASPALAKEASASRWDAGWLYLRDFFGAYYLLVPIALAVGFAYVPAIREALVRRDRRRTAVLAVFLVGACLHAGYVTRVGGDFMHGRLLLPALFAFCVPIAVVAMERRTVGVLGVLVWAAVALVWLRPPTEAATTATTFVADVHASAVGQFGVAHPIVLADFGWDAAGPNRLRYADAAAVSFGGRALSDDPAPSVDPPVTAEYGVGLPAYALGPDWSVLDLLGLGDALTAHLQVTSPGLVGHEKPLPQPWVVARLVAAGGAYDAAAMSEPALTRSLYPVAPGQLDDAVAAARTALACAPVERLTAAVSEPLDAGRFVSNLWRSFELTALRVPPDPVAAVAKLC